MVGNRAWLWALAATVALTTAETPAFALKANAARTQAETAVREVEAKVGSVRARVARAHRKSVAVERRIAEGDILLRNKDYERAILTFAQVTELHRQGKAPRFADADATFLLGESYFADGQLLSARREYRRLLERVSDSAYAPFAGRALSRLVDVALRTDDYEGIDGIAAYLEKLPGADQSGSVQYARGKVRFAQGSYDEARSALKQMPAGSEFEHQGQYLLGVVLTKEAVAAAGGDEVEAAAEGASTASGQLPQPSARARFASAIDQFRKVTRLPVSTSAQRHVVDLAWMAIGRLFYESDNYLDAADAYNHVDRKSPEFSTMLYEIAWVHVRMGDFQRAQRALEVLAVTDPDSLELADGSLLRADLMLRSGQFESALKIYESVRQRFDPIRSQVSEFLEVTTDPAVYYDQLLDEGIAGGGGQVLPPMVLTWARQEAEDAHVFSMIDDVNRSRGLVKDSRLLAAKLNALLGSSTRVKAFPELQQALQEVLGLLNQLSHARRDLALGLDDVASRSPSGELASVRANRRKMMNRVDHMPVALADFERREETGRRQWNGMSQQLQRLTLQADKLQALVNGLKRVLEDAEQFGVVQDPASRERFKAEIEANERDLQTYRQRIDEYQQAVEMGRVQIGFGDQRYVDDEKYRSAFAQLVAREVRLVASGADGEKAQSYARRIQPILERLARAEAALTPAREQLEAQTQQRAQELRLKVADEVANLETYAARLDELDQEARLLVGEVAMRNFGAVRDRLQSIVLRADIGIVQEAWELREEQRMRVRNLQRERAQEDRKLNDELREVLDDAGEAP
jgi:tetratricopeptide (TPR) repeat protein